MWLEEYLGKYKKCLVLVSHSQVRQTGGARGKGEEGEGERGKERGWETKGERECERQGEGK